MRTTVTTLLKCRTRRKSDSSSTEPLADRFLDPHSEKKWFLFDDEDVSLIDDLNGPDLFDEDGERVQSKKKPGKQKPGAGFIRADDGSMYVRLAAVDFDLELILTSVCSLPKSKDACE